MKLKIFVFLAITICAYAAEEKEKEKTAAEPKEAVESNKDKRQTQDDVLPGQLVYRQARKQKHVAPVEEPEDEDKLSQDEEYRPGQVFSLNPRELFELQPERKAPVSNSQQLQQLYSPQDQKLQQLYSPQDQKNLQQQFYYFEPQVARQVAIQPSRAVIARPHFNTNGGEASVGAALSVSDNGVSPSAGFDQDLLDLLKTVHAYPVRQDEDDVSQQQTSSQSVAPQYQQIDRYITKPSKKPTKLRSKVQINPPQATAAPQQYLIETTNIQAQPQPQVQYRPQQQRPAQALRYVPIQPAQQVIYEQRPETQGLKIVQAPKLQPRPQITYRLVPQYQPEQRQYQQPIPQYQSSEAAPKQYRLIEAPRQAHRQEQRIPASSVERPITYLKRFPDNEKVRAVKIYDQAINDGLVSQSAQLVGEQYYLRSLYRPNEPRSRYEPLPLRNLDQPRPEATKAPHSAIYVSKNVAPKKVRPSVKIEQPSSSEHINIEQHGQSLDEQRSHLPPPRNNKAYTPEEFAALVAAGYSVTPVPVSSVGPSASSRIAEAPAQPRRPLYRRNQYLPLRGDDAP